MFQPTILITDTLFILPEHEKMIRDAGYEIERLATPTASEEELVRHIKGKVGYVLGGIEKVTDNVIEAADDLKAIAFTGADWRAIVPGYAKATERGIAIANAPGANASAVAEYTLTLILAMVRSIFEAGRTGTKKFETTPSLNQLTVGIIGMGKIGGKVARALKALGANEIIYFSREQKTDIEQESGAKFVNMEELISRSDVITLHASKEAGAGYIGKNELMKMKDGAILINCGFTGSVDKDALYEELKTGRIRAAQDDPMDKRFDSLPLFNWFNSNSHRAYNTFEAAKVASDMATQSLLNLLTTGTDQYRVN
jgi:phosphoglycerate dehydrogenase-like enzyme